MQNDASDVSFNIKNIGAVVVTFHPDGDFTNRIFTITKQVAYTVIVDNCSNANAREVIKNLADHDDVELIQNDKNMGIAAALNQGISCLKNRGYKWALLLDQDTIPRKYLIKDMINTFYNCEQKSHVAVIGSNYTDFEGNQKYSFKSTENLWIFKKTVITSGSIISIPIYDIVGPFRDELFIDHVDHEFCLRTWSKGYKIIMTSKPLMSHVIGNNTKYCLLGRVITAKNHSPERYYFKSRNHVIITREYFFREPVWIIKLLFSKIYELMLLFFLEEAKLSKMKYVLKGYIDGIMNDIKY